MQQADVVGRLEFSVGLFWRCHVAVPDGRSHVGPTTTRTAGHHGEPLRITRLDGERRVEWTRVKRSLTTWSELGAWKTGPAVWQCDAAPPPRHTTEDTRSGRG